MVKDPVCGMQIDKEKAAARKEFEGETYYFCSAACYDKFNATPQSYADTAKSAHAHGGHKGCC